MPQFVIDLEDSQEKWDDLYATIAEQGEIGEGSGAGTVFALDEAPHPYLWYLAVVHGPR